MACNICFTRGRLPNGPTTLSGHCSSLAFIKGCFNNGECIKTHLKNAIHYTCSLLMEEATTRNHVRMESQLPSDNDVDDVDDDDDLKTSSLQR